MTGLRLTTAIIITAVAVSIAGMAGVGAAYVTQPTEIAAEGAH